MLADRRDRDIIAAHVTDEKSATAPAAPGPLHDKRAVGPGESPASLGPAAIHEPLARRTGPTKPDASKRAAEAESKATAASHPFVDRQLEMAVKYLRGELAKKK